MSAVDFDMNKYFQIMWIAAAILAAWLIARWPRPAIAAMLAVCAISPALIAIHHATHPAVVLSLPQAAAARWIESNTPERSVFITDTFINSPVDLAGRLRITTFGPYVSNLGYDPAPRELDVRAVFCDGPEVAAERMAAYGATLRPVVGRGGRVRRRPADRLQREPAVRDAVRPGRRQRLAPGPLRARHPTENRRGGRPRPKRR